MTSREDWIRSQARLWTEGMSSHLSDSSRLGTHTEEDDFNPPSTILTNDKEEDTNTNTSQRVAESAKKGAPTEERCEGLIQEIISQLSGGRPASASLEEDLYTVLTQVNAVRQVLPTLLPKKDISTLPLASMVVEVKTAWNEKAAEEPRRGAALTQMMDMLEFYGKADTPERAAALLSKVLEQLESLKQEQTEFNQLVRNYEALTTSRLQRLGDLAPPTMRDVVEAAMNGEEALIEKVSAPVWLEEPLGELRQVLGELTGAPEDRALFTGKPAETQDKVRGVLREAVQYMRSHTTPADQEELARGCLTQIARVVPTPVAKEFRLLDSVATEEQLERTLDALTSMSQSEDKNIFIANSIHRSLCRSFDLPLTNEDTTFHTVAESLERIEKCLLLLSTRMDSDKVGEARFIGLLQRAIEELAQLLPMIGGTTVSDASIRVKPPTLDIMEMIYLLKARLVESAQGQRQRALPLTTGSRGVDRAWAETGGTLCPQILALLRDVQLLMEQTGEGEDGSTTSPVPETPVDKDPNPPPADQFLVDVAERLKLIKSKSGKLSHSATLSKSMLTNSTRKVSTYAKKMKRVASLVESVALALKMELPSNTTADHTTDGEKEEGAVTESNVVDILKLVEKRISGDAPLQEKSEVASELDRMREVERRCVADAAAFKEALRVILMRLAESGKYTKSTLYLFGTDLQAEDDLLQEILDPARKVEDEDEEYVEKSLAALVQKYGRWAKRLHETTDDHLYAQQKIVKYITAVGRFFAPPGGDSKPLPKVVDVSLIDIDACLMKFADIILPALEAAIRNVDKKETGASNEGERVSSSKITSEGESARSKEALAELAKHSDALPYDHRLASLHEMVTRLNTIVMSLLQVRYTAIPSSTRVRSSGSVELIFEEEVPNANFIDLDLDKLIKVSSTASEKFSRDGESGEGRSVAAKDRTQENNDLLLKVTSKNLESLIRSIKSFSSNHKLSAILLQKDIDGLQQLMAGMLEKFSELDIESLTGQNREELKELYTVFTDRAQQRGCYFFNRPGGEGDCMWVNGLKQLSTAFLTVMDKYAQRGEVVSRYRELIDDCMDLCAMYMNWTERVTLPADHAVPKELEECCVRDGEIPSEASRKKALQEQGGAAAGPSLPPRPSGSGKTPAEGGKSQVSHFTEDDAILKVMTHMFQLAQEAVRGPETANTSQAPAPPPVVQPDTALEEELQLMRERIALFESRFEALLAERKVLEQERNQLQSEAAVARAELRRWKKQVTALVDDGNRPATPAAILDTPNNNNNNNGPSAPPPLLPATKLTFNSAVNTSIPSSISNPAANNNMNNNGAMNNMEPPVSDNNMSPGYNQELLQYMKTLSDELRYASQFSPQANPSYPNTNNNMDMEEGPQDLVTTPRVTRGSRSPTLRRIHKQLQEQCRSPLVVSAQPGSYASREGTPHRERRQRYSPERFQGDPYALCETYTRRHREALPPPLEDSYQYLDVPPRQQRSTPRRGPLRSSQYYSSDKVIRKAPLDQSQPARRKEKRATPQREQYFDEPYSSVSRQQTPLRQASGHGRRQASPAGGTPPRFDEALHTIQDRVRQPNDRQKSDFRRENANLRAEALRRLAQVVSNAQVGGYPSY